MPADRSRHVPERGTAIPADQPRHQASPGRISCGVGRGGFNDLPLEFGLGDATQIQDVTIRWPNGLVQDLGSVAMDQVVAVTEPLGSDFNQDGDSNILDFVAYQTGFASGDPLADVDGNCQFNILDFVAFQQAFSD